MNYGKMATLCRNGTLEQRDLQIPIMGWGQGTCKYSHCSKTHFIFTLSCGDMRVTKTSQIESWRSGTFKSISKY